MKFPLSLFVLLSFLISQHLASQTIPLFGPDGYVRIEEGSGGFIADLDAGDRFSRDHDVIGDLNGDGILDMVVGARSDDDGQTDAGAVYILFMNNDGTVQANQKISMLEGGFDDSLNQSNFFGYGVAGIGDYDGDGIPDIAVSAPNSSNNSLYIIHLYETGMVKDYVKTTDIIAQGLSAVGDLNEDGRIDIVSCDSRSNSGGTERGSIQILFFNEDSEIIEDEVVTISSTEGGFGEGLEDFDNFGGRESAMLGDIDGDGTLELAVGAFMSDGGKGAIWILSLDPSTFNVVSKLKITEGLNGFTDILDTEVNPNGTFGGQFGHALCSPGDLNGDGINDIITGANQQGRGDAYILYLNSDKTVKTFTKINDTEGGFGLDFGEDPEERFSRSISFVGDLRGDGTIAVNIGGGVGVGGTGTLYLLFFKPCDFVQEPDFNRWSNTGTLFSNWNHLTQSLTSDSLSFEQCSFKSFETEAAHMTYNYNDGRCICMDSTSELVESTELSNAYTNECFGESAVNNLIEYNSENLVEVYPNPTEATAILAVGKSTFSNDDHYSIYNLVGELIYESNLTSEQTVLDLSSYPSGIYTLVVNTAGSFQVLKVVRK
ncbi:MAG: FG-GAP-like repeat-containing protein [Flavobacteriales bacterium]